MIKHTDHYCVHIFLPESAWKIDLTKIYDWNEDCWHNQRKIEKKTDEQSEDR